MSQPLSGNGSSRLACVPGAQFDRGRVIRIKTPEREVPHEGRSRVLMVSVRSRGASAAQAIS